jgi:hypothetical protein
MMNITLPDAHRTPIHRTQEHEDATREVASFFQKLQYRCLGFRLRILDMGHGQRDAGRNKD